MITNKFFGIKEQIAAKKAIEDAELLETANRLYLSLDRKQDNLSEFLLELKKSDNAREFENFFRNNANWIELWESPVYEDIIVPMVKYWYKKKFEDGESANGLIMKREFPTGLIKFGIQEYKKRRRDDISVLWHLLEEIIGDFRYHPDKRFRISITEEGIWFISTSTKSFIPMDLFDKDFKDNIIDYIGKELIFNAEKDIIEETPALKSEINDIKELFGQKNSNNKLEEIDVQLLLNNLNISAQSSALSSEEYPVFHEIKIKGEQYPVPSLALFTGLNALQEHDTISVYYTPLKLYLVSKNGSFSIVDIMMTGITYANIVLGAFKKGITIRQAEMLEVAKPNTIEIPQDLLQRRPILKDILHKQKLIKENYYENILILINEYIKTYTKKVWVKKGDEDVEVIYGKLRPQDENDFNYVYEVEEIFWQYNSDILPEELLAYFVSIGKNETYQNLCLRILGIDYMYDYETLVDVLIDNKLLMIENIIVDEPTRTLVNLKYNYLHIYGSGDIYKKTQKLKDNFSHILNYYGEELGQNIVAAQSRILTDMTPTACTLVAADKERQLELDFNNSIFWDKEFPDLNIKGQRQPKSIIKLFEDYLVNATKLGGITDDMIRNVYMFPLTKKQFIETYILPKWKHNGKAVKIEKLSALKILDGIFPKYRKPYQKTKRGKPQFDRMGNPIMIVPPAKMDDFTPEEKREGRIVYNAIITKYHYATSVIIKEGSRLFNMFLRNELTAASQDIVASRWNEKFNNYKSPKESKIPVFLKLARYFGNNELFELNEVQLNGVKFAAARNNNALIAHEVGLGKTTMALAFTSHLFETNQLERILVLTPTRVYSKFIKEAKGGDNFRGAVPHINIVELENAKPNKFEPKINEKTGEIIENKLKKYTKDEISIYRIYKTFLKDIDTQVSRMENRRFEVDESNLDLIKKTLDSYIPNYTQYQFFNDLIDRIETNMNDYLGIISRTIESILEKYAEEGKVMTDAEKLEVKIKYGNDFSSETRADLDAMKNKILDEFGYYLPEYMKPQTIILGTHIALEELRPKEETVKEISKIVDDSDNYEELRNVTKEWKRIINLQAVSLEKLNIDGIIIDEAHNFNELVTHIRPRYIRRFGRQGNYEYSYNKLPIGSGESLGRHLVKNWYKIGETDARKMTALAITQETKSRIMLSATPFTEGPLHALSIMNLVNRQLLKEMNYESTFNFFNNFIFELWKIDTKQEKTGLFASVDKYRNAAALCNFMSAFADFKLGGKEMDAKRPTKYILPDESLELNGVTSYIPHNEAQEYLKSRISDFVNKKIEKDDICKTEEEIEAERIADEDANQHNIDGLIRGGNAGVKFLNEARTWQAAALQAKINISPYFIECEPPGNILPPLEELVKDANGNPIVIEEEVLDASGNPVLDGNGNPMIIKHTQNARARNFVLNSPKILYTIQCIKTVLKEHRDKGESPSGQIIYMNLGKSFKYKGVTYSDTGNNPKGSAYTLIKKYIAHYSPEMGLSEDEIGIVHAGINAEQTEQTIKKFNSGEIKVLIGSSTIREGIDLQKNATVMYILQAEFNPTNAIQLEGRIWRQGNKWKNVKIVYVLSYNSNDIFVYSKVKAKIQSIKAIMRAGRCDMNETQIFSINPEEVQMQLNTNAEEKAKIWWQITDKIIREQMNDIDREKTLLQLVKREYPKVKEKYEEFIEQLNYLGKVLEGVKFRDLRDRVISELRVDNKTASREELGKEADKLIAEGKYKLTEKETHKEFSLTMGHSDFIERLDYIRTNYRIAEDYRKHRDREEVKQQKLEFEEKTRQEIYWTALIKIGFDNYSDFRETAEKFKRGSNYDKVLSAFNSQILSYINPKTGKPEPKQYSDIDDIVESIQKAYKELQKRINNSKKEIETQKKVFEEETEQMKKQGEFDLFSQVNAFAQSNYLLVERK